MAAGLGPLGLGLPAWAAETANLPDWNWAWAGELGLFSAKVVIAIGIPVAVIAYFVVDALKPRRSGGPAMAEADGESDVENFFSMFRPRRKPRGVPKEYLKVERLNDRLQSYRFSLTKALEGSGPALIAALRSDFGRRFGGELASSLTEPQLKAITQAERTWREERAASGGEAQQLTAELRVKAVRAAGPTKSPGEAEGQDEADAAQSGPLALLTAMSQRNDAPEWTTAVQRLQESDAKYITAISRALQPEQRAKFQRLLQSVPQLLLPVDQYATAEQGGSLSAKHVFVLKFFGDIQASQVKQLRQEVTAILGSARVERGDEVVLVLKSGGGTVTGYGLAAAQLLRLRAKGLQLTICVEEVAASGGYMMACTADRLVASPFAVLGSIGVVSDLPNVYERLRREGVEFITTTAGKYKRTLLPTKEPTEEDKAKVKEDLEATFALFKQFIRANRPVLDIEDVATGEVWFGQDALDRRLCDELMTPDDVLLQFLDQGAELYALTYKPPPESPLELLLPEPASTGLLRNLLVRLLLPGITAAPPAMAAPLAPPPQGVGRHRFEARDPAVQLRDPQYAEDPLDLW